MKSQCLSKLIRELRDISISNSKLGDYPPVLKFLEDELERKTTHVELVAMNPSDPSEERDAIQNHNACRTAKETLERYLNGPATSAGPWDR